MNIFTKITQVCHLGELSDIPQRVTGGYLHKMYKLETTSGRYALKLLNPLIMQRPDVMDNYRRAERLEGILCDYGLPVVTSLEFDGHKMQCLDGQYYYLFDWIDGRALGWNEIREEHCAIAGSLLARIHRIDVRKEIPEYKPVQMAHFDFPWDEYVELSKRECTEIMKELRDNRDLLYNAQSIYNQAIDDVPKAVCISDGDMDSKNVLWVNGSPYIIDLEALDYGNPYIEAVQLALDWSGGVTCDIDQRKMNAFLRAYRAEYGGLPESLDKISGAGFKWLDWLAYNTRRALGLECGSEEERKLGIGQVHETIQRIVYYDAVREKILTTPGK